MKYERLNLPAFFEACHYSPHKGQWRMHEATARVRVLACGTRWGKSTAAAMEALAAATAPTRASIGWIVAPTYDLAGRVFRVVANTAHERIPTRVLGFSKADHTLDLVNAKGLTATIRCKSADNPISLLGEGLDWLIVDEAAQLRPNVWQEYLTQRLLDRKGWALLISTPKGKGWYYDLYRRGQHPDYPDTESWASSTYENPHIDPKEIDAERDRLPDRVFRETYLAEFTEGSGSVFRGVRDCATGGWQEPSDRHRYFAGVDLAKVEDYTVLVVVDETLRVVHADRFHRLDWHTQIQRLKAALERYNAKALVDSTGAGEPVFEAMRKAGLAVQPYPFTAASRTALIDRLTLAFERGELSLPSPKVWPAGIDELEAYQYHLTPQGKARTEAPAGEHDDCVMALGLAVWCRDQRMRVPGITVVGAAR